MHGGGGRGGTAEVLARPHTNPNPNLARPHLSLLSLLEPELDMDAELDIDAVDGGGGGGGDGGGEGGDGDEDNGGPIVLAPLEEEDQRETFPDNASPLSSPSSSPSDPSDPSDPSAADVDASDAPAERLFKCPRCGRRFHEWASCHAHMTHRRHFGKGPPSGTSSSSEIEAEAAAAVAGPSVGSGVEVDSHGPNPWNESYHSFHTGCLYDTARARVPECMAEHSLLPRDTLSGWCDLVGRRRLMEDSHCLYHSQARGYSLYGVFDGHTGSRASKFASKFIGQLFARYLEEGGAGDEVGGGGGGALEGDLDEEDVEAMGLAGQGQRLRHLNPSLGEDQLPPLAKPGALLLSSSSPNSFSSSFSPSLPNGGNAAPLLAGAVSAAQAVSAMQLAFISTSSYINEYTGNGHQGGGTAPNPNHSPNRPASSISASAPVGSGTTAAVAVVFNQHLLVANTGDSRVILCCTPAGQPVVLTVDHTPNVEAERSRIVRRGGYVQNTGKTLRVNGQLAVTRSIGDSHLSALLTPRPDVLILRLEAAPLSDSATPCADLRSRLSLDTSPVQQQIRYAGGPMFLILGSDGLFDVVGNAEAADMVCAHLLRHWHWAGHGHGHAGRGRGEGWLEPSDALLHGAAKVLAQEAFVRGSGDNIGVCVVALDLGF